MDDKMMMDRHGRIQQLLNIKWGIITVDENGKKINTISTWSKVKEV